MPGRVARPDRGLYFVATSDGVVTTEASRALLDSAEDAQAIPAVGDWVAISRPADAEYAFIEGVLPRKSAFVRHDPGEATSAQVLAANFDHVLVCHSLETDVNVRRIERELVIAWESGANPAVVLTKADLAGDADAEKQRVEEVAHDVPVYVTSCVDGRGVEQIGSLAEGRRTLVLLGPSGVGKSTLVNELVGGEVQATREVRAYDKKGRHTTVARELIPLPGGGMVIDTPGLRALALWDVDVGMSKAFPEIAELAEQCRFRDCGHDAEPGCAVTAAVESGTLSEKRLASFRRLKQELVRVDARREEREWAKSEGLRNRRSRRRGM